MARTARARIFRSTNITTNVNALATTFGTTANAATSAQYATGGAVTWRRWVPGSATSDALTPPAAPPPDVFPAAAKGWRDDAPEHASEPVRYAAGTWTVRVRLTKTGQTVVADITVRVMVIVYRMNSGGTFQQEIGRVQMADTTLSTATLTLSGGFTTAVATDLAVGDRLHTECYVTPVVAGTPAAPAAAVNVNFVVDETSANSGASFTAQPTYDILYARSYAVTGVGVAAMARKITAFRSFAVTAIGLRAVAKEVRPLPKAVTAVGTATNPRKAITTVPKAVTALGVAANPRKAITTVPKTTTAIGSAAMARQVVVARSFSTTAIGTAAMARAATYRKTITATAVGTAAAARRLIMARTAAVSAVGVVSNPSKSVGVRRSATAVGAATMARTITAARTFTTSAVGVANFGRALVFGRQFSSTATGVASGRVDMPMSALNRIIPAPAGDWPLNTPTKVIAGVTRSSTGSVLGSCTVKLIRQSDDVRVASTTSHPTTGAYSFTRGGDDPNSYRVLATKAGVPEVHGVTDELVPA